MYPDRGGELYERAERFARSKKLSMAEVARRGIEELLQRYPQGERITGEWQLPVVKTGSVQVPVSKLKDITAEDEFGRAFGGHSKQGA